MKPSNIQAVQFAKTTRDILAASLLSLLVSCGGGGSAAPSNNPNSFTVTIGAAGGTATTGNQAVEIRVPPNAVSTKTTFTASPTKVSVSTEKTLGNVYDFGPEAITFSQPVTLQFSVSPTDLSDEWSLSPYGLSYWAQGAWIEVPSQSNNVSRSVSADVGHFSTWAVTKRADPPITSPDHTWGSSASGCLTATGQGDTQYNQKLGILGQTLFGLSAPPTQGNGCINLPYLADKYSYWFPTNENHAGIDFRASKGTPIFAPFDGEVVWQQLDPAAGKSTLTIKSTVGGNDYLLMFLHCQSHLLKRQGQTLWQLSHSNPDLAKRQVLQGDQICEGGSVGAAGSHLHFEVRRTGNDAGNLLGMSGKRGVCLRDNLAFQGYNSKTGQFDLLTEPGCPLTAIRTENVDPTVLYLPTVTTSTLNDTGITSMQCYQAGSDVLVDCASAGAIALNNAQDGMVGRDANAATNSNADGKLGFSFSAVADGANPNGCVQDNVTGLMWENKTNDGGLRDWNKTYTNYSATYDPSGLYGSATDASGFVTAVNTTNLCGYSDWRMPTADELQSIVDYGVFYPGPAIDATWFPNTQGFVWSASPYIGAGGTVNAPSFAWHVDFSYGVVNGGPRYSSRYVRLVRAGQSIISSRYTPSTDGQEITDNKTKLIWRRCAEGMSWNGSTCAGTASTFTHEASLQLATTQANTTGIAWRLPNVKELSSIVDKNLGNPAIDPAAFPATPASWFWSTSSYAGSSVWFVYFDGGDISISGRNGSNYAVRLVRSAPPLPKAPKPVFGAF